MIRSSSNPAGEPIGLWNKISEPSGDATGAAQAAGTDSVASSSCCSASAGAARAGLHRLRELTVAINGLEREITELRGRRAMSTHEHPHSHEPQLTNRTWRSPRWSAVTSSVAGVAVLRAPTI